MSYKNFITESHKHLDRYLLQFGEEYIVSDVNYVLTRNKFDSLCKISKRINKTYYPVLSYHGTRSPSTINSIVKHGYIMPGDLHPDGYVCCIHHGNYHGDGIYSSDRFDIAGWYSFLDKYNCIQIIINIVVLGKVQMIDDVPGVYVPINGLYSNTYHTRIKPDLSVIVSGSEEYIVPLCVMTMVPKTNYKKCRQYLCWNGTLHNLKETCITDRPNMPIVILNKIVNDIYTITIPQLLQTDKLRHHIIMPLSVASELYIINSVSNFIESLDNKILWLYDKNTYKYILSDGSSYQNHILHHKRWNGESFNVLDRVFDYITKDNECLYYDVIHLIINKPIDTYQHIIDKYGMVIKVKKTIIKLIYVDVNQYATHSSLKNKLQTVHYYEKLYHTTDDGNMNSIFNTILAEIGNIPISKIHLKIPYPNGVIGEGYINNLTTNPDWDVRCNSIPLYKGQYTKYLVINNIPYKVIMLDDMNVSKATLSMINLLAKFRNHVMEENSRYKRYEGIITLLCGGILNRIENELDNPSSIKYIKRFYQYISSILSDIKTYANVSFEGKWFDSLIQMKFSKK